MRRKITEQEAESIRSGYLPPSAAGKVSPAMREYHGVTCGNPHNSSLNDECAVWLAARHAALAASAHEPASLTHHYPPRCFLWVPQPKINKARRALPARVMDSRTREDKQRGGGAVNEQRQTKRGGKVEVGDILVPFGTPHLITRIVPYMHPTIQAPGWRIAYAGDGWGITLEPQSDYEVA